MAWFEYPSNYSSGLNVSGVGSFIQYGNSLVNNSLGLAYVIIIWTALFGINLVLGTKKALMTSSFITFILSVYLYRIGLIHPLVIFTLIVLTIIGVIGSGSDKSL